MSEPRGPSRPLVAGSQQPKRRRSIVAAVGLATVLVMTMLSSTGAAAEIHDLAEESPGAEVDAVTTSPDTARRLPYPASRWGLTINRSSLRGGFPGADNFPFSWAVNPNKQYTSWGDGAGPSDSTKRSIGVAQTTEQYPRKRDVTSLFAKRMHGPPNGTGQENECGSQIPSNPALNPEKMPDGTVFGDNRLCGKSYGLLAVKSNTGPRERLYMWASPGSGGGGWTSNTLFESTNSGATWTKLYSVEHDKTGGNRYGGLNTPTFLQAGPGYTQVGAVGDRWIYVYWVLRDRSAGGLYGNNNAGGKVYLTRVDRDNIGRRGAWYIQKNGAWNRINITNFNATRDGSPIFRDPNGVGWSISASYLPTRKRYVLMTEHDTSLRGKFGMFESSTPWGPWRTVAYYEDFGKCLPGLNGKNAFFWNFSLRWSQTEQARAPRPRNNHRYWMAFTGINQDDRLGLVQVELEPRRTNNQGVTNPKVNTC